MNMIREAVRSVIRSNRNAQQESSADTGKGKGPVVLDGVTDGADLAAGPFADQWSDANSSVMAVSAIQQWAETQDLGEGEGYADRLLSLLIGLIDEDIDGELSEEEANDLMDLCDAVADYLESLGVSDDDISSLLNDWDNDAGERVQELVAGKLEEGADAADFVFGDGSDEAALDAVYKKKLVIRKGKKVRINKRVSGTVRLSAAQKVAVAKMRRKSQTAVAKMRRAKSVRIGKKMGI